ncbi:hypothetical protein Tco_0692156 [Tanacetum coccineum]
MSRAVGTHDDEAGSQEENFTSEAWRRMFNINAPIYTELCHEFYSTYDFNEVCTNEELRMKKLINFRLRGRSYSLTWLEFARRLGLYRPQEINGEGFDVYFQGVLQKMITYGLCQRTTGYDKMQKNEIWLMSMFEVKYQNGYANVTWLMEKWLKKKGVGSQKDSMICCGQIITKIAKKMHLLTNEVLNTLSAPNYCRALDATTLKGIDQLKGKVRF